MTGPHAGDQLMWGLVSFGAGFVLYLWGWRGMRRRWAILNLPTSRVRSVAMGTAELIGKARGLETELRSPVRQLPCVWYRVRVTRETGSGKNRHTETVFAQTLGVPFELEDTTGRILVVPEGAEVTGTETCDVQVVWGLMTPDLSSFLGRIGVLGGSGHRVREWAVLADAETYVLGEVGKLREAAEGRRRQVADLLQGWLKSPERKAAIDADHDGRIDQGEWDAARGAAQAEVLGAESAAPAGPALAVRKPRTGYFLVAAGGEKAALKAQGYPVLFVTAGILLVGLGVGLLHEAGSVPGAAWGGAGAVALAGGWGIVRHLRR
ncbi:MAG: GIDE domain-containing protein [Candidatus Coatesbacteria bacterium]